jgi:hypothetical protein
MIGRKAQRIALKCEKLLKYALAEPAAATCNSIRSGL